MHAMREHFVVIGGGQAAAQAVQTARHNGYAGRITLVGAEDVPPYQRPPLSKQYLAGKLSRERLLLKPERFYTSRDVDLLLGRRAVELDPGRRRVGLDDGGTLEYSRLLVATGGRVRRLRDMRGERLEGIHYLRTVADVDAIMAELAPDRRLVIIGAGYIGLEVAAVCVGLGLAVTVLEAGERVMARAVCPQMSDFYAARHRREGVDLRCGAGVERFRGSGRVEAVDAAGETFPADLVLVGIGIEPEVTLAERAGLPCDNGISVDAEARTPDPHVLAAGDCTSHPHPFIGRRIRLESVHNAIEQAKSAAGALTGEPRAFADVPWFWSDQYDLKLQIAGLALDYDETVVRGEIESGRFSIYYLRAGRPVAVDSVNNPREFVRAKTLLAARPAIPAAAIADPGTDLDAYVTPA